MLNALGLSFRVGPSEIAGLGRTMVEKNYKRKSILVKKLLLDPVIISQNKTKFLSQDPKIYVMSMVGEKNLSPFFD